MGPGLGVGCRVPDVHGADLSKQRLKWLDMDLDMDPDMDVEMGSTRDPDLDPDTIRADSVQEAVDDMPCEAEADRHSDTGRDRDDANMIFG